MMAELGPVIAPGILNAILLLFLYWLVSRNRILSPRRTQHYKIALLLTIFMLLAENLTVAADAGGPGWRVVNLLCNTLGFAFSPLLPIVLASIYTENSRDSLALLLPQALVAAAALISPFTGWIFSVSPENVYQRGPFFFFYVLSYLYSFAILIFATIRQTKGFGKPARRFFLGICAVILAGTTLQVMVPSIHTTWQSVTCMLTLYYLFQRELQFQYDVLTGLLNREAFQREFDRLAGVPSVLVMILDVDRFKQVNDRYGHLAGDRCLQTMAKVLRETLGPLGQCFRIGGDEFCVLGAACAESRVEECGAALRARLAELQKQDPTLPSITWGYAITPGSLLEDGWQKADQALYAGKAANGGRRRGDLQTEQV